MARKREINYNFLFDYSSKESRFFTPLPSTSVKSVKSWRTIEIRRRVDLGRRKPKGVLANFGIVCKEAMRISLGEPTSHHGLGNGMRLRTVNDIPYGR